VFLGSLNTASAASSSPNIFEILSKGDGITFVGGGPTTKSIIIGPEEFIASSGANVFVDPQANFLRVDPQSTTPPFLHAPVDVPDGATITEFQCKITDQDPVVSTEVGCKLFETDFADNSVIELSNLFTSFTSDFPDEVLVDSSLNHLVDLDTKRYHVRYEEQSPVLCNSCALFAMKIIYQIPNGMIVGGEFYPVDNVSLFLAHAMINSYWLAPTAVGIGAGIYLTRNKWKR